MGVIVNLENVTVKNIDFFSKKIVANRTCWTILQTFDPCGPGTLPGKLSLAFMGD